MSKWRQLADEFEGASDPRANSAISANSPPIGTNGANGTGALPATVVMGINRLAAMPVPRGAAPCVWEEIVADALRLRDDGWAAAALALGWSELDLWGHSDRLDGLAVWLRGRPVLLLAAASLIADDGDGMRAGFYRCRDGMPGAKLLWEIIR